ncbi:MAG: imidazole glycerol phosphate synthase subunit HisH [Bacteroidota bacterium]
MKIALVKYGAGNTSSVLFALQRLGHTGQVTDDPHLLVSADKVIFPGVGEAGAAMAYLRQKGLDRLLPSLRQPVLGICLGMQLMCSYSEESDTPCLGIFDKRVKRFGPGLKVPQIGWNNIHDLKGELFEGIAENAYMYFVHSYYAVCDDYDTARTDYGIGYCSAMQKNNFYAVQFHPEKSGAAGQKLLENFLKL